MALSRSGSWAPWLGVELGTRNPELPENDLPSGLGQPARRALAGAGIQSLAQVSLFSQVELSRLHGIGPHAVTKLRLALAEKGLSFRDEVQENE